MNEGAMLGLFGLFKACDQFPGTLAKDRDSISSGTYSSALGRRAAVTAPGMQASVSHPPDDTLASTS